MDINNESSRVKFEEDNWKQSAPSFRDETPKIVRLVIKWSGGSLTERQVEYALFAFFVVAMLISAVLFFSIGPSNTKEPPIMPSTGI